MSWISGPSLPEGEPYKVTTMTGFGYDTILERLAEQADSNAAWRERARLDSTDGGKYEACNQQGIGLRIAIGEILLHRANPGNAVEEDTTNRAIDAIAAAGHWLEWRKREGK